MAFEKEATGYNEQIELLRGRGLEVADENLAKHYLMHHNYYRICAYRFALSEEKNSDQFMAGTTFEDLVFLYEFDRKLRLLVLDAIDRVEISIRSRWAYEIAHGISPFAYTDSNHFSDAQQHTAWLAKLDEEISRSHETFIKHHRDKYGISRPPTWAACEVMSLGSLSRAYSMLKRRKIRNNIAKSYHFPEQILGSVLHHLSHVRNICAHHSRLWNRSFTITMRLPQKNPAILTQSLHVQKTRNIYNTLSVLRHFMMSIDPSAQWHGTIKDHLQTLPKNLAPMMGLSADWEATPLWS